MADQPKSLDGSTTVDEKVVFEAQRLSYEAARNIAENLAPALRDAIAEALQDMCNPEGNERSLNPVKDNP